ncbi:hypothetical protein [Reichenbachiella sp.]
MKISTFLLMCLVVVLGISSCASEEDEPQPAASSSKIGNGDLLELIGAAQE